MKTNEEALAIMEAPGRVSQTPRVENSGIPSVGKVCKASWERYHKVPPIGTRTVRRKGKLPTGAFTGFTPLDFQTLTQLLWPLESDSGGHRPQSSLENRHLSWWLLQDLGERKGRVAEEGQREGDTEKGGDKATLEKKGLDVVRMINLMTIWPFS